MCDKTVDTYPSIKKYVPDRCKTQEMCDKANDRWPFVFDSVPNQYKTQGMCNKGVDDFLPALKFVPDWFVTGKIIKKLLTVLYADDNILFFDE